MALIASTSRLCGELRLHDDYRQWNRQRQCRHQPVTSLNGLGVINVTHSFSPIGPGIGPGPNDNNNPLLFPSELLGPVPWRNAVPGHLAITQYGKTLPGTPPVPTNSTSTVTFNLNGYNSQNTIFGMWNTTTEVAQPPYRLEYVNANSVLGPPTTAWQFLGNTQNIGSGVTGTNKLVMNLANGNISAGAPNPPGPGLNVHTDAAFWRIPAGTKQIIVHGNLGVINGNTEGDGVGYYFADLCPTEGNLADLIATTACSATATRSSPTSPITRSATCPTRV